jgi:hypothetical protein
VFPGGVEDAFAAGIIVGLIIDWAKGGLMKAAIYTRIALATLCCLLAFATSASAEEWGGIEPGVTTIEQVRARYGAPNKETHTKVESYDTTEWVYEDPRAPGGILKMTVDFGLLTPQGYKPALVRVLRLEPKSKVFGRVTVIQGFGVPDGMTIQNDQQVFFYQSGLIVTFDKEGDEAVLMSFTPPQPARPPSAAPAAPKR